MARTSKTKIGGEGESNDRMMRAASSGAEAVAQAHGQVLNQHRAGAQQVQETSRDIGNTLNAGANRQQQQQQFDTSIDLEGAKAGFERSSKLDAEMAQGGGEGKIGPLDAESQQRLQEQGQKPMEMDATGKWRPTEERKQSQAREATRKDFEADSDRMRALAYRDQVGISAQKALAAGDMATYKEKAEQLAKTPNDMQKRYDRFMKGDVNTNDWGELSKLAQGGPDSDPSLMGDLKSKQFTPRVAAFVRAQVQKDALSSIVLSKGNTSNLEVDWTAPQMRMFQEQVSNLNAFMKSNPAMSQLAFIKSTDDKMRFLNVMAASQVLLGMTQAPSPAAGMMPATQAPGAPEAAAPGAQQFDQTQGTARPGAPGPGAEAVRAARAGGASPQESLQAGQNVQPTGGMQGRNRGQELFGPK